MDKTLGISLSLPLRLLFSFWYVAVLIKGGVWKNTEDEILKAAVMKYGLNQWARISSLLSRKSAKQCKARWYEWLDPAIKKTEWTREEDEKLLHLAKLMPTQWRTIAPIVGRTPTQCLERYERLLDMAAGKDDEQNLKDDPRRLRPGEIDPNPETKPARPDPVDMDDDEKEMLSEARARLANTRGKKAKRKAREKQLEEARRLATLQKQRELKAAGIEVREKMRRGQGIDYAKEVAFERRPAPGFYDTSEENQRTREVQEEFRPVKKGDLERPKRKEIDEELAKRDAARRKAAERNNIPEAVARAMAAAEAAGPSTRRGKMMLPAPQVTDAELEAIARQGAGGMDGLEAGGSAATRALIGDYATPARFATPMRTPAVGAGDDRVMTEAQNLRRLQEGQTPLLGGENPDLSSSDFSGVTPRRSTVSTPHPMTMASSEPSTNTVHDAAVPTTSQRGSIAGVSATPRRIGPGDSSMPPPPGRKSVSTPLRDAFGLNDPESMHGTNANDGMATEGVLGKRRMSEMESVLNRNELRSGLARLPAPQNEYEIALPDAAEDLEREKDYARGSTIEIEDAEEVQKRQMEAEAAALEEALRRRSQVLQRDLPRPLKPAIVDERDGISKLLSSEMSRMIEFDASAYPNDAKSSHASVAVLPPATDPDRPPEEDLVRASALLCSEMENVKDAMGHEGVPIEQYVHEWNEERSKIMYAPGRGQFARTADLSDAEQLAALRWEFENVRREMERDAKRAAKLEQKIEILIGGLQNRQNAMVEEIEEARKQTASAAIELQCYRALHDQEGRAAPERIEELQVLVDAQRERERILQERYGSLLRQQRFPQDDTNAAAVSAQEGIHA